MSVPTTSSCKLLARLSELAKAAGHNYYERISIANQLLEDKEWIGREFKGDDYKAATVLEVKYFHDLSGSMTIWMLLQIYRKFNKEKTWEDANYNLRALYARCKPETTKGSGTRSTVRIAEFEKVQQEAQEARFHVNKLKKEVNDKESELEQLRKMVAKLENENLRLKGRIEELERIVQGRLSA